MKVRFQYIVFFLVTSFLGSCAQNNCCDPQPPGDTQGDWLLTERGYSPGAGYIVEPVSLVPPQTISIDGKGRFSSNISGLENFQFYQVLEDPTTGDQILALYTELPTSEPPLDELLHSYNVVFEEGLLKLYFRFCFEGCHLGFIRNNE